MSPKDPSPKRTRIVVTPPDRDHGPDDKERDKYNGRYLSPEDIAEMAKEPPPSPPTPPAKEIDWRKRKPSA